MSWAPPAKHRNRKPDEDTLHERENDNPQHDTTTKREKDCVGLQSVCRPKLAAATARHVASA